MTIASMTGFAREAGERGDFAWIWEAKSVNGRSLDLRFRLPGGYETLEPALRPILAERIKRGNVTINLAIEDKLAASRLVVNEAALAQVIELAERLSGRLAASPPSIDGLLNLRGVLETAIPSPDPAEIAARGEALLASFANLATALAAMRKIEGRHLAATLGDHLAAIETLVATARAHAAAQLPAIQARLARQIGELLPGDLGLDRGLDPGRLAQEAALLATRADIREELDRLSGHIAAARDLVAMGGAQGRKLDFLCQEFHREANTLCAKAADIGLTAIGIELKSTIEQMREQIQNIE